jgi:preprotein translocase subunit SecE
LFAGILDPFGWDAKIIGSELVLSTVIGIAIGVLGGIYLWRNERVFGLAHEVVGELTKVTWPSWPETRLSTIVVMVTTLIMAVVLWAYDTGFSALTRLVYGI